MRKDFKIGKFTIGDSHRPFIIAEMSGNHNQSIERAFAIVDAAAKAGAQALKLQTYTADTITLDVEEGEFFIKDHKLWQGTSLHKLFQVAYTPWEWHEPIMKRAQEHGMVCFSTPFDETAVDYLENLRVPCYKIASFENIHLPLIKKVAQTGKPIIMSTGLASIAELDDAVRTIRENGNPPLTLLKCTSTYPASPDNTNILTIPHMRDLFRGCHVGLSDHTMGIGVAVGAVALGARVIEKHFTLRRADGGVDSAFSMEPEEMAALVAESERAHQALGQIFYGPTEKEMSSLVYRRSLYIAQDMKPGEIFNPQNLRVVRPGLGLMPKFYEVLLGRKVSKAVKKGTPVSWDLIL